MKDRKVNATAAKHQPTQAQLWWLLQTCLPWTLSTQPGAVVLHLLFSTVSPALSWEPGMRQTDRDHLLRS